MEQMTLGDEHEEETVNVTDDDISGETDDLEASETSQEDQDTDDLTEGHPKKGGVQKKIDKLTRRAKTAEQRLDFYKKLALMGGQKGKETQDDPNAFSKPRPHEDQFDNYTDFIEALTDWKTDKKDFEREKERRVERDVQNQATIRTQAAESRKKHEDFDEVTGDPFLQVTPEMNEAAMGEHYTEIIYALGKNPDLAAQIAVLTPTQQAKEIGKIEARITGKPITETTRAPEPFDQISSGGSSAPKKSLDKMSRKERFAQWEEDRLKEAKARGMA